VIRGRGAALLAVGALALAGGFAASGDGASAASNPAELLVRFEPGAAQQRALAAVGATLVERLSAKGLVRVRLAAGASAAEAERTLERRSDVVRAEPNRTYQLFETTPNDPDWLELWGLPAIKAPLAWDVTTGSDAVTVAVVDSGVDYNHPDLVDNMWTNPSEAMDGLDNDGNGLIDDVRGWDYYAGDAAPLDELDHGTHVAGTIGARGHNLQGVVGVNWRVKLLPLRVGHQTLSGAAIVNSFRYACAKGARVVNGSFGGGYSEEIHQAIAECPNTLFVFAAGNSSRNNDIFPTHPCGDPSPNVICVAASQLGDTLAVFSNYGVTSVDLAAPGADILSTIRGGLFDYFNGTSMASPHVAGAAALVLAQRPQLSAIELRNAVLLSVDLVPSLAGLVTTGGRLNVARALGQEVQPPVGLAASSTSHPAGIWTNRQTVTLSWGGASDVNGIDGYSYAFSPASTFVPDEIKEAEETTTSVTSTLPDGEHWFHVRARDGSGNWGDAVHVGPIRVDTFQPVRPVPSSPTHRVGGASADRTIVAAWSGGSDTASGVDGYSFSWSQGRAGTPDQVKNVEETVTRTTSPRLAVGAWWFNIRARDNAGNWSDAVSLGPFSIRGGPTACAVPRLRGLTLRAAKRVLAKRGCSLGRVSRAFSRRVSRGRVVAQRPAPGLRLRRGARIAVTLSRGRR
jgi:subtilisin family serine protease